MQGTNERNGRRSKKEDGKHGKFYVPNTHRGMDHPVILECVSDFLTLGELCRLRRALGMQRFDACPNLGHLALRRMNLVRIPADFSSVCRVMTSSKHRCRECGRTTRRMIRVCEACARQKNGFFQLISRREMFVRWRNVRGELVRRVYKSMTPTTRRSTGEFLYWRANVDAIMTSYGHAPMQA